MRKVIVGLVLLVVLLVAAAVIAIMNVNSYLEQNRDSLAGLASDAAGRDVSFEGADVAFSSGLAVHVRGLRVGEDPRFGKSDFVSLDDAYVAIKILPALQRRIEVSGIRLDAPTIRIIQTAAGFNYSTLGAKDAKPAEGNTPPEAAGAPFAVAIAALEIDGGTIYYEDRTSRDGLNLVIDEFNSSGTDLSFEGPIAIDFSGRARSGATAGKASEKGLESRIAGEVRLESLETMVGTVHLTSPSLHPAIFGVRLDEEGAVERLDAFAVDAVLTADPAKQGYPVQVRSKAGRLGGFDLDSAAVDLVYRDSNRGAKIQLDEVLVKSLGGSIDLKGNLVLGKPGQSPFALTTQIRDLDSNQLAVIFLGLPTGMLSGRIAGDASLKGDSLEWESLKQSLAGSLDLKVGEGALEKVNVLNTLVGRLVADPGLGQLAANVIRDVAPNSLDGNRTAFKAIEMIFEIADGAVHAKNLSLSAGDFGLEGAGLVGLDGRLSADGTIRLSENLSRKILAKADRLGPLLGDGKIVSIPLHLGGTTGAPKLTPDLAALTQKATAGAKQELTNRATKELGDAIFGKNRANDEADPAKKAERDSTEGLIKEGLGRLLGR